MRLVSLAEAAQNGGAMAITREQVLELYFMEARSKLVDLAAFLDRVERAEGADDFRMAALRNALKELDGGQPDRASRVLRDRKSVV